MKYNWKDKSRIGSKTKELWKTPEYRRKMVESHIGISRTHGMSKTRFYWVWTDMVSRCNRPNHAAYKNYGGRGIKVEWSDFQSFSDDMYAGYLEHKKNNATTTIDRIDNDGNYSKENCRWATRSEQQKNTRPYLAARHNKQ